MALETPTTSTIDTQASLKQFVFPTTGEGGSFDEEKEWDRITADLEGPVEDAPTSTPPKQYRVLYLPIEGLSGASAIDMSSPSYYQNVDSFPIFFPLDDALLATKIWEEITALFSMYGSEGINNLYGSIEISRIRKFTYFSANYSVDQARDLAQDEEHYISPEEIQAAYEKVYHELVRQAPALRKAALKLLPKIQEAAATLADDQLKKAGCEILHEATRYLAMDTRTDSAAQDLLENTKHPADVILRGPDVPALVGALRQIQARNAAFDRKTSRAQQDITSVQRDVNALALTVTVKCREFPILHRIWRQVNLTDDVQVSTSSGSEPSLLAKARAGGLAISELKVAVFTTLQKAWQSNIALREQIKSDPKIVWSFPPLIHATLDQLSQKDSSYAALTIGYRAAEERLEAEKAMSLVSILSLFTGVLGIVAAISSVAPPIGLALAAIDLILSSFILVLEFFTLRTEDRAFNAVLDPTKALSSEPGYGWFIVNVVCTLLQIKGVRDALQKVRLAAGVTGLQKVIGDTSSTSLESLREGVNISAELGQFIERRSGVVLHPFGPLLREDGKKAGRLIFQFQKAFEVYMESGTEASFGTAWRAYLRLQKLALKLPIEERIRVGLELERQAQTLLIKQSDIAKLWAETLEQTAKLRVVRLVERAAQQEKAIFKAMASLEEILSRERNSETVLYKIWKSYTRFVSPNSQPVRTAAGIAARDAENVKNLLRNTKLPAALRRQGLTGYMVNVRNALGEGYALLNKVWLNEKDVLLADAERIAESLGPGYEAHYATQLEHAIRLNTREGPDALIVILNRETKEAILHTSVQVKTAKVSEAIEQTIFDQLRSVGQEVGRKKEILLPFGTLELRFEKTAEVFALSARGNLSVKRYIMSAIGGRLPAEDIGLLEKLGIHVTGFEMDMSIDQLTHLAITVMEAALKAL